MDTIFYSKNIVMRSINLFDLAYSKCTLSCIPTVKIEEISDTILRYRQIQNSQYLEIARLRCEVSMMPFERHSRYTASYTEQHLEKCR